MKRKHHLLLLLLMAMALGGCDIADCMEDRHCEVDLNECCARVIVKDSVGNKIDSHYCL
jgi:hypothetical protein